MRAIIIGAGMGGLTLAHALHRAGVEVSVHDRDAEAAATGGYRLHLDAGACDALRRHLDPRRYQALLASSARGGGAGRFTVADHRMRVLAASDGDPGAETLMIGRVPLRRLLAGGLDGAVRFGSTFTGFTRAGGRVTARFADGSTETADLLVGADGVGSRVATALAGGPTSAPVGVTGLAGRTPLDERTRRHLPGWLADGPGLAFGPGGIGLFLTRHDPTDAAVDPDHAAHAVDPLVEPPAVIWGVMGPDGAFPAGVRERRGPELVEVATAALAGWAPSVRALVGASDPASPAAYGYHAADPATGLTPWAAGPVTALGDAVHAMPPTGGRAAATAIRDADLLATELAALDHDPATIPLAVHRFELGMAAYAPGAVRESLRPLRWMHAAEGRAGRLLARAALPVLAGAARLHAPAVRRERSARRAA